ncbi:conserved hypothetical protein [Echinococcus multilocularis]|uniref:Uncharacterized protein n=1 Tax=Echinococcus multilocularis TaxID=6211 RepID=A0A087W2E2_ECHMU|nr:conserved hypothetical protein [Echinococcus multilocularis]
MAAITGDDDLIKNCEESIDTFSQTSTKLAPCDWRSTLFQVESFTPSTESPVESDTSAEVSYHPEWYSVGYLTDSRYNSSSFSKILPKPQKCGEIPPIVRHSMLIFNELESDFNVYFSTKVSFRAAEIKGCSYRVPLPLVSIEFTPASFIAHEFSNESFNTGRGNDERINDCQCVSVDWHTVAKESPLCSIDMQSQEPERTESAFYVRLKESKSLKVPMQIFLHHHLHRCRREKILLLRHRYPRVLRDIPDPISAITSTRAVLTYSILIHIEPILKENASKIGRKYWQHKNNFLNERPVADIDRLELSPAHTLEVFGSMRKTARSLKLTACSASSGEKTMSYHDTVNSVLQNAPSLTKSKVLLAQIKTVSSGRADGTHPNMPINALSYCIAKSLTLHLSGRKFRQECFHPNILQQSLPHLQREPCLMQQVEVVSHNVAEVEVANERPCDGRPENRSPPEDSASPCLSFYLIPEKRPSSQITLDVKCCPASDKAMLDALPADGANCVERRFLKLISQKAKFHRRKPPKPRTEECNVVTPSLLQNYCAITLND